MSKILWNYPCVSDRLLRYNLYLPVLGCDDDVIQEWQKEEVEALKPKEHGSFIPQHLLKISRENSFFVFTNTLLICHRINTAAGRIICQLSPYV